MIETNLIGAILMIGLLGSGIDLDLSPLIIDAVAYPEKVMPGDTLYTQVSVVDTYGIVSVIANITHEQGYDLVSMPLISGTEKKGVYEIPWIVHDTLDQKWYNTTIIVENERGFVSYVVVSWFDPVVSHTSSQINPGSFKMGNYTFPDSLFINMSVGIGTTTPLSTLHINSSSATGAFRITNGTESPLFFVNGSNGNVGIGTASPQAALSVYDTASTQARFFGYDTISGVHDGNGQIQLGNVVTASALIHYDYVTAGTQLWIDNTYDNTGSAVGIRTRTSGTPLITLYAVDGKVGIGTTNPTRLLTIADDTEANIAIYTASDADTNYAGIRAYKAGGTVASPTIVANGEDLMQFVAYGYDGNSYEISSKILSEIDGTPGDGDVPGRLTFWTTADGSASPSERMRIDSSGYVGIGTTSPDLLLDLEGDGTNLRIYRKTSSAIEYLTDWYSDVGGTKVMKWRVEADGDTISATNSYTSDIRAKKDIADLEIGGLDTVDRLEAKQFKLKDGKDILLYGFIAQDIEMILPNLVRDDGVDDGQGGQYKALNYNGLFAVLTKAIQELNTKHEELKQQKDTEIQELKSKLQQTNEQNKALKELVCLDHPTAQICQ